MGTCAYSTLILIGLPSLFLAIMVFAAWAQQCHQPSWAFYLEAPHYLAIEP
jgi:hypothetical protein